MVEAANKCVKPQNNEILEEANTELTRNPTNAEIELTIKEMWEWRLPKHFNIPDSFIDKLKDLHEFTAYKMKGSTSDSSTFYPQRDLREDCTSPPILFNIYHQAPIRTYQ